MKPLTQPLFLENVNDHQLTVKLDENGYRHLLFRQPENIFYWFEIITSPGLITINGDMGTFVFSAYGREDMFTFFRKKSGSISPAYWSEKLLASSEPVEEFSYSTLKDCLADAYNSYSTYLDLTEEEQTEVESKIRDEILDRAEEVRSIEEYNHSIFPLIYRFKSHNVEFIDASDWNPTNYTLRYLWSLYAIVWAINTYDRKQSSND